MQSNIITIMTVIACIIALIRAWQTRDVPNTQKDAGIISTVFGVVWVLAEMFDWPRYVIALNAICSIILLELDTHYRDRQAKERWHNRQ